jgi:hypothetical protein
VTGFAARERPGWALSTPKGKVSAAGMVILAVNGHLESFGIEIRPADAALPLRGDDAGARAPMQLARHRRTKPRWGITPSDPMGTTVRRIDTGQGGNRIVTRTCAAL